MRYKDRVYGETEISEPVILELINAPAIQRLKKIDQAGYKPLWVKPEFQMGKYDNSRFAHSLGVFILLRKYQAPAEEQIAGLVHDVSHSAFSHCIDYVVEGGSGKEQNYQDNVFNHFVKNSEIPAILKKYNFDLDYILDDKNFPLKERDLPDLCADRIDYSLRTAVIFKEIEQKEAQEFLDNLIVEDKKWVFKNFEKAKAFAQLFFMLNKNYYASLQAALMFITVRECLRYALEKRYISKNDFYTTDEAVVKKIKKYLAKDAKLSLLFERMNGKIGFTQNRDNYDFAVFCKSRAVNPWCRCNGQLMRVSDIDPDWDKIVKDELKPKQYFLKFDK